VPYGWRVRKIDLMAWHAGIDGHGIRCDPSGHCQWVARSSVAAARMRIYEASRGPLPPGVRLENTCSVNRCVNIDHVRLLRVAVGRSGPGRCLRGHELVPANVVRHRDGRVAYCRACRNERRRERYRNDPTYARREIDRQRRLRRGT